MPFVEIKANNVNNALVNEISVDRDRIRIASNLVDDYFIDSQSAKIFIDEENGLMGIKEYGVSRLRKLSSGSAYIIRLAELKKFNLKSGRYPAEWSEKHWMIIAKVEFNE